MLFPVPLGPANRRAVFAPHQGGRVEGQPVQGGQESHGQPRNEGVAEVLPIGYEGRRHVCDGFTATHVRDPHTARGGDVDALYVGRPVLNAYVLTSVPGAAPLCGTVTLGDAFSVVVDDHGHPDGIGLQEPGPILEDSPDAVGLLDHRQDVRGIGAVFHRDAHHGELHAMLQGKIAEEGIVGSFKFDQVRPSRRPRLPCAPARPLPAGGGAPHPPARRRSPVQGPGSRPQAP